MKQAYEQLQDGRFEEAVETFSASLVVGPKAAPALRGRGLAYLQLKRWSLAAVDFAAARDVAPEDPDNWVELGKSLAMDHQVYPAIEVFETLLARHPACVRGHIELGLVYLRVGAIPKARQALERALTCRPTLVERRIIETLLNEQQHLDKKRLYRPDFEALHQQGQAGGVTTRWTQRVREWFARLRRGLSNPH